MILQSCHIDHTNLKPTATAEDIHKLCDEAIAHKFRGVCVHPCYVNLVSNWLFDTDIKVVAVVGFPLGANTTTVKVTEAKYAINDGADEIDVVWDLGSFKAGDYIRTLVQLSKIVAVVKNRRGCMLKVIVETCYLDLAEIKKAFQIVLDSGADCIKTSTGFGSSGAELRIVSELVELREQKQCVLKIKAAGGIRDYQTALQFISRGADIIGTSHSARIMGEQQQQLRGSHE